MWPEANVAIATGKAAGIFVLDVDADSYGYDTLFELLNAHEPIPPTPRSLTGGGGEHYLFAYPTTPIGNSSGKVGPGVDTRGEGGYIVAPPSVHISGRPYSWDESSRPESTAVAPIPTWLLGILLQRIPEGPQGASAVIGDIWKGARDNTLASLAGTMRRRGMSEAAILAALHEENAARCVPPLSDEDVRRIARSISGYTPGDENPSNITIARRIE
jgi:putative DNA primase/helicase